MNVPPDKDPTSIGNLLIRAGVLSLDDVVAGLSHARRTQMRLGEALCDLGLVTPALLNAVLAAQSGARASDSKTKTRSVSTILAAARASIRETQEHLVRLEATATALRRKP